MAATRPRSKLGSSPSNAHLLAEGWRESWCPGAGVQLHVVEAGQRGNPLLILLHGFPEYWWGWRHQITALSQAGFHVAAPDMRGYNLSERPTTLLAYRLEKLAADIAALAHRMGAASFDLVGHDWGGVIAWAVAAANPGDVRRLIVLNAPHPDRFGRYMIRHPTQVLRSSYAGFLQLPGIPERLLSRSNFAPLRASMRSSSRPGTFTEDELDHYAEAWARPQALTAMINYYRALRLRRTAETSRISVPTLLLWGERDRFLEKGLAEDALKACDDGRLQLIPEATHWLHHEERETVAEAIRAFLI